MAIFGIKAGLPEHTHYFSAPDTCKPGDSVLVQQEQGIMPGKIISGPLQILPGLSKDDVPAILRLPTPEDEETIWKNNELAAQATIFCKKCIAARNLDMKLVHVEVFFDRSKLLFYFTAPNRIDFRELVKDLVREYRSRIELRQIGVRHETQMKGAIGNCGQVCCCRRYLRKFAPVTIKMAKEQNLFLNPSKISGICGRLLCCLSYEQDNYEQFHHASPRSGKKYQTIKGPVKVLRSSMFKNTVTYIANGSQEQEVSLEEWKAMNPVRLAPEPNSSDSDDDSDLPEYRKWEIPED